MRNLLLLLMVVLLCGACGRRRPSAAELQHKIDSVRALEQIEELERQGISLQEASPIRLFYDSLAIQTLPLNYTEEYMKLLPNYTVVPYEIFTLLGLEGRRAPKAIALPETLGTRLILLAADVADGEYELWLYSLDDDFYPVDKFQLFEPAKVSKKKVKPNNQTTYFSITSNYEIRLMEYVDENDTEGQLSTFVVDDSRMFVEQRPL